MATRSATRTVAPNPWVAWPRCCRSCSAFVAVRAPNGNRPVALLAHSWGASVAAAYASHHPQDVWALVLFAPIVPRTTASAPDAPAAPLPSHFATSIWAQYRRFVQDVPRGQPQVLSELHFQAWSQAYLASDPDATRRVDAGRADGRCTSLVVRRVAV